MKRNEFFQKICGMGICCCSGIALLARQTGTDFTTSKEVSETDWRIGFMQRRFAKFINICNSRIDSELKNEIIEQLGRECARERKDEFTKFRGQVREYLKEIETKWVEKTEYDEITGEINIYGKKQLKCFCPFVDAALMSKDFCLCTKGWQKETFETILERPVDVRIESSVLWGGERCSFKINVIS